MNPPLVVLAGDYKASARDDVLRFDWFARVVEIGEVAGEHIDGADRKADRLAVDDREIDEPLQCFTQRPVIVIARRPGWPAIIVIHELVALRALRKTSPSGVNGQIFRSVMNSQSGSIVGRAHCRR